MKLQTSLRGWLSVGRVQSIPVTVLPASIAAFAAPGTISKVEYGLFVAVLACAHVGIYMHNEIQDYEHDIESGRTDKALVSGEAERSEVGKASLILLLVSEAAAVLLFGLEGIILLMSCILIGLFYNTHSKKIWFSEIYLGIWGFLITMTGAYYVSGPTLDIVTFGVAFGFYMVWMTYIGDYRDMTSDEANTLTALGARVVSGTFIPSKKSIVWGVAVFTYPILLCLFVIFNNDLITGLLAIILSGGVAYNSWQFIQMREYMGEESTRLITSNTILFASLLGITGASMASTSHVALLVIFSVVYGVAVQLALYGSWSYFA